MREAGELDDEVKIDPSPEDYAWVDLLFVDPKVGEDEQQAPSSMSIEVHKIPNFVDGPSTNVLRLEEQLPSSNTMNKTSYSHYEASCENVNRD